MIGISGTLSKAWMAQALGVRFDRAYYFDPGKRREVDCRCNEYAGEQFGGMRLFYSESNLGRILKNQSVQKFRSTTGTQAILKTLANRVTMFIDTYLKILRKKLLIR